MEKYPSYFGFSVSCTSRKPREGEIHGVHYNFSTVEEIEARIKNGEYLEHATVHTNKYGTTYNAVRVVQDAGKICILDIDVQGAKNVKENSNLQCKYLFVAPPSIEELGNRLRKRNTETEEKIQIRLTNAVGEIEYGNTPGTVDAMLVNESLDDTIAAVISLLKEWYPECDWN